MIENGIGNDRKHHAFGPLMPLNRIIETEAGYTFSRPNFDALAGEVGFRTTRSRSSRWGLEKF